MAPADHHSPTDVLSYDDLYRRWEHQQWSATDLDFTEDARQWKEMSEFERKAALFNYALFFWGEDAVTDDLSPYIVAAPLEEQKYFLATQQVDEARHAIFFKRFFHEVCGIGDGSIGGGLREIEGMLTPGFRHIFAQLESISNSLHRDSSVPNLAAAVTLYHLVVEAMLAQPGQHMIADYLEQRDMLPAFREGIAHVTNDEQRHIGFGVKILSDLREMDPGVPAAVAKVLRRSLPWSSQVLMPPNWDERYVSVFGYTFDRLGEESVASIQSKLRAAGLAVDSLPGRPAMLPGMTPLEVGRRGRELAEAGIFGERTAPSSRDEGTLEILFDTLERNLHNVGNSFKPSVYEWDFTDSDVGPWQLRLVGPSAKASPGRKASADLVFRIAYQDWVDIVGERLSPVRAVATRRLRLHGNPLLLKQLGAALA